MDAAYKPINKTKVLALRLDEDTLLKLHDWTKKVRLSKSEFVRKAVLTTIEMLEEGEIEL